MPGERGPNSEAAWGQALKEAALRESEKNLEGQISEIGKNAQSAKDVGGLDKFIEQATALDKTASEEKLSAVRKRIEELNTSPGENPPKLAEVVYFKKKVLPKEIRKAT